MESEGKGLRSKPASACPEGILEQLRPEKVSWGCAKCCASVHLLVCSKPSGNALCGLPPGHIPPALRRRDAAVSRDHIAWTSSMGKWGCDGLVG